MLADRSQFFKDLSAPFYGANRPGAKVSQGLRDSFWLQGMMGGLNAAYDCIKAFSETDFTEDLKKFDVPTLILHGDDDQIVPIGASALLSSKIVKGATLKVYSRRAARHVFHPQGSDQFRPSPILQAPRAEGRLAPSLGIRCHPGCPPSRVPRRRRAGAKESRPMRLLWAFDGRGSRGQHIKKKPPGARAVFVYRLCTDFSSSQPATG